jgi:hypothetical protein
LESNRKKHNYTHAKSFETRTLRKAPGFLFGQFQKFSRAIHLVPYLLSKSVDIVEHRIQGSRLMKVSKAFSSFKVAASAICLPMSHPPDLGRLNSSGQLRVSLINLPENASGMIMIDKVMMILMSNGAYRCFGVFSCFFIFMVKEFLEMRYCVLS